MNKRLIIFIIAISIAVSGVTVYFAIGNDHETKQSAAPRHLTRSQKSEHTATDTALEQQLTQWAQEQNEEYGIVVQELDNQRRIAAYQADKPFIAASTYKPFLTYAVLREVEQGNITLQSRIRDGRTVQQCIDALLLQSDNSCSWPTGALIGWDNIDAMVQSQFPRTNINNYDSAGSFLSAEKITTATDQALFMQKLSSGTLLNETHSQLMVSRLKRQIWRERIPAGVPEGIEVADKPGWLDGIQNDTAIVYGSKSIYILAVLSSGPGASPAKLADLSQHVYDYLNDSP